YILPRIKTAYIIAISIFTIMKDKVNSLGVVLYKQPVSGELTVSIDWERFIIQDIVNTQRNQFLWKMIRAIIIRAVGDHYRKTVCIMIGSYEMIRRGLGCRIWRMWVVSCCFRKQSLLA